MSFYSTIYGCIIEVQHIDCMLQPVLWAFNSSNDCIKFMQQCCSS